MKIALATACGDKKHNFRTQAYKLYKSPRIKTVYNRKNDCDMYILSAKHNLLPAEKVITPYNEIMTMKKAKQFVPIIADKLNNEGYNWVVFFKGGANLNYLYCIRESCKKAKINFISIGFAFQGDMGQLSEVIRLIKKEKISEISLNDLAKNPILDINENE